MGRQPIQTFLHKLGFKSTPGALVACLGSCLKVWTFLLSTGFGCRIPRLLRWKQMHVRSLGRRDSEQAHLFMSLSASM